MNEEVSLWKGASSQWLNAGPFLVAVVFAAVLIVLAILFPQAAWLALAGLLLPMGYAVWKYLEVRTRVYELTSERLRTTYGVINQHVDEIELYRVKDTVLSRPWWMRLTGLASITLDTSDRSLPNLVIPAIRDGSEVREQLRRQVESLRDRKRVREMDFDDAGGDTADFTS